MIYDEHALAKYRLERCEESLADCELLLRSGSVPGALAMALRAAREAARAALLASGSPNTRSDSFLRLVAGFVKQGKSQASSYAAFRNLMDLHQYASERDFAAVSKPEATAAIEAAKFFIREMADIIKGIKS
jgi:uncharacterized protein (UPF0332 family)